MLKNKIFYCQAVYGKAEKDAVVKSLENGWLASGPLVTLFEKKIARLFGKKYGVAVNSGSSANLLAIAVLGLAKGSEIITPACTYATTASEIIKNGHVPVFIDSVIGRYVLDERLVENAITAKTKAILTPQLIGGISNMVVLKKIADKHHLKLVDDSCDTFAPTLGGKKVADYADITTTSFYGSHIITACGIGGMLLTDNPDYAQKAISLRDWGRSGNDSEEFNKRYSSKIAGVPYDSKFLYTEFGYNLKMNEVAAAFGLAQLKRLTGFIQKRKSLFNSLTNHFAKYTDWFYLPYLVQGAKTAWLAFPLCIKPKAPFQRYNYLKHLEKNGIQTRVLFSGNITRHPVYQNNRNTWRVEGTLSNADYIMANAFLLGCHPGMTESDITYIMAVSEKFFTTG